MDSQSSSQMLYSSELRLAFFNHRTVLDMIESENRERKITSKFLKATEYMKDVVVSSLSLSLSLNSVIELIAAIKFICK